MLNEICFSGSESDSILDRNCINLKSVSSQTLIYCLHLFDDLWYSSLAFDLKRVKLVIHIIS